MSEIVHRLREEALEWRVGDVVLEAADEIERLERENKFLRGKLEIAEDAIKETASRAHNRLATLHDMQPA